MVKVSVSLTVSPVDRATADLQPLVIIYFATFSGCGFALTAWFSDSADTLLVIGFCVIGFLKFTFLTILHYEIREMVQKIRMLENETNQVMLTLTARSTPFILSIILNIRAQQTKKWPEKYFTFTFSIFNAATVKFDLNIEPQL